jgi:hypothetical protein
MPRRSPESLIPPQYRPQRFDPFLSFAKLIPQDANHIGLCAVTHRIDGFGDGVTAALFPGARSLRRRSRKLRFIGWVFRPMHIPFLHLLFRGSCELNALGQPDWFLPTSKNGAVTRMKFKM